MATALEKFRQQRAAMKSVLGDRRIEGEDMATLLESVIEIVEKNGLFERDIITGRYRSMALSDAPDHFLEHAQAQNLFRTFFSDKMFIVKKSDHGHVFRALTQEQQSTIFNQMMELCTYNSRKEIYESIPQWDGVPRIQTFMWDYFMCKANWHFFLLFLTYIVGVLDDPSSTIIEHWFDFVSDSRGTGKTTFFKHLLAGIGCEKNAFECSADKRGLDDFWAELYTSNAILAIDDECKLLEKISYDTWKAMVTARSDTFSRKFQNPETHARPFIFVRTSNHPKTVYALNERRQIIFNIGLPEQVCKHWELDNNYMAQLIAEAKDYYVKNGGIYKLTQAEKDEILDQNLENTSTETPEYHIIENFIEYLEEHRGEYSVELVKAPEEGYLWSSWAKFMDWARDNKVSIGNLKYGSVFWKNMEVYAKKNSPYVWYKDNQSKIVKSRSTVRVFGFGSSYEMPTEDVSDIPF